MHTIVKSVLPRVVGFQNPVDLLESTSDAVVPGVNQFTKEEIGRLKSHKQFREYVKNGNFEIVKGAEVPADTKSKQEVEHKNEGSLQDMGYNKEESLRLIDQTSSTTLLRKWQETDTRGTIVGYIARKLAKIAEERGDGKKKSA